MKHVEHNPHISRPSGPARWKSCSTSKSNHLPSDNEAVDARIKFHLHEQKEIKSFLEFQCWKVSCYVYTSTQLSWIVSLFQNKEVNRLGTFVLCLPIYEMRTSWTLRKTSQLCIRFSVTSVLFCWLSVLSPQPRVWQIGSRGAVGVVMAPGWGTRGQYCVITTWHVIRDWLHCHTKGMAFL
jgi:hypothetical protein